MIFFTGEERRNFAVFIPKLFQYDYEFVIKVINFGFFLIVIIMQLINLFEFDTKVINFRFLIVVIKQNRSVGIRHHQVTNFGFFFIFHIFNQLINIFLKWQP